MLEPPGVVQAVGAAAVRRRKIHLPNASQDCRCVAVGQVCRTLQVDCTDRLGRVGKEQDFVQDLQVDYTDRQGDREVGQDFVQDCRLI